jgi:hypothetical protein
MAAREPPRKEEADVDGEDEKDPFHSGEWVVLFSSVPAWEGERLLRWAEWARTQGQRPGLRLLGEVDYMVPLFSECLLESFTREIYCTQKKYTIRNK